MNMQINRWIDDDYPEPMPAPPVDRSFMTELRSPMHLGAITWERSVPEPGEVSLKDGVWLESGFPDPDGRLVTALRDFKRFLKSAGISNRVRGGHPLRLRHRAVKGFESYRIEVRRSGTTILAGDTEGVRRALIYLEDACLRAGGPFLRLGSIRRVPAVRTRINLHVPMTGKGAGGLIADAYLNRLAHDGVNGLMLPLQDLYRGRLVPEFDGDPAPLFKRLKRYVDRYARYGIKLFVYVLEPQAFPPGSPLPDRYPERVGGDASQGFSFYCPSSPQGLAGIRDAFNQFVGGVPGLGGMIVICVGERRTHCASGCVAGMRATYCPRCSKRKPRDVLRDVLAAMEQGIHAADPEAELIAWPYSQYLSWGETLTRDFAGHVPPRTVLMHNFESAYRARQLGRTRRGDDYWLSFPGPSTLFEDCARAARRKRTRMFAKLMIGCSHELASVPFIPVPGNLYRRFTALRELGVTGALQNWSSGNDPSLMNRAAGDLAFDPLPSSETAFLERLARRDWGAHAPTVVEAWTQFRDAYEQYPLTIAFGYYGPMHNGPVWPLYLEPRNLALRRNWTSDPPGGDRIGDCLGYHRLDEVITLCRRMLAGWSAGVRLLDPLERVTRGNPEREMQVAVARAIELQFRSGLNILQFYEARERLTHAPVADRLRILDEMASLVRAEREVDARLLPLATAFPRLGYCPEARAYKYSPDQIRWRMRTLDVLLRREFARVRRRLQAGRLAFPHVPPGTSLRGFVYRCPRSDRSPPHRGIPVGGIWDRLPEQRLALAPGATDSGRLTTWKAARDRRALYFGFCCQEPDMSCVRAQAKDPCQLGSDDQIDLFIETSQFEPQHRFMINALGSREYFEASGMNSISPRVKDSWLDDLAAARNYRWSAKACQSRDGWSLTLRIPFASLGLHSEFPAPIRFQIFRQSDLVEHPEIQCLTESVNPAEPLDGPLNFGWMRFDAKVRS